MQSLNMEVSVNCTTYWWQIPTSIWCGLIMSTTGTPLVWVRQQTKPGCCGTSLHWHKAADCELLFPPELLLNVTGNIFFTSFWSLLHGATNVFPANKRNWWVIITIVVWWPMCLLGSKQSMQAQALMVQDVSQKT